MITYPPDNHKTDSKTIFFLGSAKKYCKINGKEVARYENGNFCEIVKLKLGENTFEIDSDGELSKRKVVGIRSSTSKPVAYGQHYDAFPSEHPNKRNILKSILVSHDSIKIPLNIAPIYNLERLGSYKYVLDLADIDMDLDWIHYEKECCPIIVGEVINSRFPIIFSKPVTNIKERWEDDNLILDAEYSEQDFRVCIDPGHGGSQTGTRSPKGILEKDLNLKLSILLKKELDKLGVNSVMTREDDRFVALEDRMSIAKEYNCQAFLSIHHNALPDSRDPRLERGISSHYFHEQSKAFAIYLLNKLCTYTELPSAGFFKHNLHVLREATDSVSVLLELGFLIHPIESEIISSDEFQSLAARIIAKAIYNFYGKSTK